MHRSQWFSQQLQSSTEGFRWAITLIPPERHFLPPRPGKWPVARILFHLCWYDRLIGLPTLRQWEDESFSDAGLTGSAEGDAALEEASWQQGKGHDVQAMLAEF